MKTMGDRLKWAREKRAMIGSARQAAIRLLRIRPSTYAAHENGQNEYDAETAQFYGLKYRVSPGWLLTGKGDPVEQTAPQGAVRLVGYIAAGEAHFDEAGDLGEVNLPDLAPETTVAVEIRGESLGALFDRWIVYYDRIEKPPERLAGELCVVRTEDGRTLLKKLKRSRARGPYYHLLSQTEEPILDVKVEWAAKVKSLSPR